jgi:hypothetical protein
MSCFLFALAVLVVAQSTPTATQKSPAPAAQSASQSEPPVGIGKAVSLSKVHRIFVESFGTDPISQQMQAMVISSLTGSDRFTVTEDRSKADAILKGVATQATSHEVHAYGSGTAVGTASGGVHADLSGAAGGFGAAQAAINDSSVNTESIDSAHASVRLVNGDGDVIWTTTQESDGAKFRGASADVADKIAKQLAKDAEKADKIVADQPASK